MSVKANVLLASFVDRIELSFDHKKTGKKMRSFFREATVYVRPQLTSSMMSNKGRQCLMARRLVERGVRFVELSCCSHGIGGGGEGNPWDQHKDLKKGHLEMDEQVDGPIGALITDLKNRGLLEQTLLVFTGEFGRTPFSQGSNGHDHDPFGFGLWLAGGGIQGGSTHGATDEFGYKAQTDISTVYDLWATVLHQLGIDHEKLTYRWSGRDLRLTDVHGHVWKDILA